ncbi:RagB/SusD family nutrient uptake outer membrane protein [Gracilimonas sediminicola]|uniref:RagB/SusD family nutrient uptake outer membrane protein n=1 Tax=Gracilimonas sediminicola TaxID=2952158 RepID=A0A9X2L4R8_9BACT|nr:RagB/SusD family nutrient uptake outer membrane protein [Gracilimonas sediminicola]
MAVLFTGCNDFLTPSVDQAKETADAINTPDDLQAMVYGALDDMNGTDLYGRDWIVANEVRSDNMWSSSASNRFGAPSQHVYTTNNGYALSFWDTPYEAIANANIAINAELESSPEVDHIKGQAYFLRALLHFDLVRTFGQQHAGGTAGVPIITTYNEGNLLPARATVQEVYDAVISDLETAEDLIDPSIAGDVTVPTYWAIKALQSRVLLTTGDYPGAIAAADDVIDNGPFTIPADSTALAAAWATDESSNSIFELGYTPTNNAGNNSIARIYQNTNYGDVEMNQATYDLYATDDYRFGLVAVEDVSGDNQYRLVGKYPDEINGDDNIRMLRIEEVILNKAEAQARNNATGLEIATTLNQLADNRYPVSPYVGTASLADVLLERRLELLGEGDYFHTQMRDEQDIAPDEDPGGFQTLVYPDFRSAFPIPQVEMDANSSMVQNTGYQGNN